MKLNWLASLVGINEFPIGNDEWDVVRVILYNSEETVQRVRMMEIISSTVKTDTNT